MSSDAPLDGTVAVITGSSAGIGRASALELTQDGANVVLAARRRPKLEDLAAEIRDRTGVRAVPVETDVRDVEQVERLIETTTDEFGRVDILVNNAGITGPGYEKLEEISMEDYHRIIETNVNGMFYTTRAALPHLRESRGNLIFIGSSSALLPRPAAAVYASSKWWTRGFALSVEAHAGQDGVAVSLINPTAVRTRLWKDRLAPGEAAEPEELGRVVAFTARQEPHTTLSEVNLFRRDLLGKFVPEEIDLDVAFPLPEEEE